MWDNEGRLPSNLITDAWVAANDYLGSAWAVVDQPVNHRELKEDQMPWKNKFDDYKRPTSPSSNNGGTREKAMARQKEKILWSLIQEQKTWQHDMMNRKAFLSRKTYPETDTHTSEPQEQSNALSDSQLQSFFRKYDYSDGREPTYILKPGIDLWTKSLSAGLDVWTGSLSPMWFRFEEHGWKPEKFTEVDIGTDLKDSVIGFVFGFVEEITGQVLHGFSVDYWKTFFRTMFEGECAYPGSHPTIFRKGSERIIEGLRVPGENVESYRKCFSSTHFLFISF